MKIHHHKYKNRIVLELEKHELILIAHLIEQCHDRLKDKMKKPLSSDIHKKLQEFIKDEM